PLAPFLNVANLRLLDPAGNLLASGNSTANGQIVSLLAVSLPTDGVYRIQVRGGSPSAVGNYALTLQDSRVDTYPLVFDQKAVGVVDTTTSVDRWTFAAAANQQVQLNLLGASTSSVRFKLTGPNNYVGFSNLAASS